MLFAHRLHLLRRWALAAWSAAESAVLRRRSKVVSFPRFRGSNSAPHGRRTARKIMFPRRCLKSRDFVVDSNGGRPKRVTFSAAASYFADVEPPKRAKAWYVSATAGHSQALHENADGTNTTEPICPTKASH